MNDNRITVIKVRRGLNGYKYAACRDNGGFIRNFEKLADVRRHWSKKNKMGVVALVRELDKMPDMSQIEETKRLIVNILKSYARK